MKRLSLKEVNELLKGDQNYCIRINEFTRKIHIIKFNINRLDEIIGYITFNQFIKLDLLFGLKDIPIRDFVNDYYTLKK